MNKRQEIKELADYLKGFSDATDNKKILKASEYLENLHVHTCGQGMIGCYGGDNCGSDHK